jgi:hypothetical protein
MARSKKMTKDDADDPRKPSRRTLCTPESKPKRPGESSDAESKKPTITEEVRRLFHSERLDRGYGVYQPWRRHRGNIEPLDQLLGPAGKEAEHAKPRKPDDRSED